MSSSTAVTKAAVPRGWLTGRRLHCASAGSAVRLPGRLSVVSRAKTSIPQTADPARRKSADREAIKQGKSEFPGVGQVPVRRWHRQAPGLSNISQFKRRHKSSEQPADTRAVAVIPKQQPGSLPTWPFPGSLFGAHKPLFLIATSGHILFTACQLSDVPNLPAWMPCAVGAIIGGLFAVLNRWGMARFWRAPTGPLSVVITGATRGLGKALAREFLRAGDTVLVSSRSAIAVRKVIAELREEVHPDVQVRGLDCDVSSPSSVDRLASTAFSIMQGVDVWINNAAVSGSFQAFTEARAEQVQEVVSTNLTGTLLCTRRAMQLMAAQPHGRRGHIFNMDGAGADMGPTPNYTAYGATKAAIAHLMSSLAQEAKQRNLPVSIHTLSPGMVLTNLLLEGTSDSCKAAFNILCEHPETVAAFLVPRVRTAVARRTTVSYIRFLTTQRAVVRLLTAPFNLFRFFDSQGRPTFKGEGERIVARSTVRRADRFARRSRGLSLAYSSTMAASYLLLTLHALHLRIPLP